MADICVDEVVHKGMYTPDNEGNISQEFLIYHVTCILCNHLNF